MLKLHSITKSFVGVFEPVLQEINLSIKKGEFCVVIGANGSGKSTLFKVISGEYKPDQGKVHCCGYVSQVVQDINKGTISSMTLLENIALSRICYKKPKFAFYRRYKDDILLKIKSLGLDLESNLHQPINNLSGGQRQIIATLMAIHSGGQILLLDEHTSALDPKMHTILMEYTANAIAKLQLTTMMITHKMDDVMKYGSRLIMLHKGRIVLDLSGREKEALTMSQLLTMFHKYEDEF